MATKFNIDTLHSHVGFSVKHLMISNVKGNFKNFSGSFEFENGNFKSLTTEIDVNSINTGEPNRDKHLKSADFFDLSNYPNLTFKMFKYLPDSDEDGIMEGEITIRGVTKPIQLDTEINGIIENQGKKHLGFTLKGKLNRKDFGLNWNGLIEAGGVVVSDEIKLTIEVEAISE